MEVPGGSAQQWLSAETQRASPPDCFPVEPPSEMVTLFLRQDTNYWRISSAEASIEPALERFASPFRLSSSLRTR